MAKHDQREFVDETVVLDDNWYIACQFIRCRLVYTGGPLPTLQSSSFKNCEWEFSEQAGRVLILLRALNTLGLEPAGRAVEYIQGSPRHEWLRVTS